METDLRELIKGFITLKYEETNNMSMALDSVETYLMGVFYEVQAEEMAKLKFDEEMEI